MVTAKTRANLLHEQIVLELLTMSKKQTHYAALHILYAAVNSLEVTKKMGRTIIKLFYTTCMGSPEQCTEFICLIHAVYQIPCTVDLV